MSVTINIVGDLILDQTAGLQDDDVALGVTVNAGPDNDVLTGSLDTDFLNFLNNTSPLQPSDAQVAFAANVGGASDPDLVQVDVTDGETIGKLFFSDNTGNDFEGVLVPGVTTLDGSPLYFWSEANGKVVIITTSNVDDSSGAIVAAFRIESHDGTNTAATVESITFSPLLHTDPTADDETLSFSDLLRVSAVVTQNVGDHINVDDDAPTIVTSGDGPPLTVDESNFAGDDSQSFAANFDSDAGTDGQASLTYALSISLDGADSGLVDTASGDPIVLTVNSGVVEGHVGTVGGALSFTVEVDTNGVVTLDQILAIVHPDTGDDNDSTSLASADLVTLTATIVDNDGDSKSADLDIGLNLHFLDDGPSVSANETDLLPLIVDETDLGVSDTQNFAGNFDHAFGADGEGTLVYSLGIGGTASGLTDTATGDPVFLVDNGDTVEGHVLNALGALVFTAELDPLTGDIELTQFRAVIHANPNDPDDNVTLASADLVTLTATITDGDGDSHDAVINIGQNLNFGDDGPSITASDDELDLIVDETVLATNATQDFSTQFDSLPGADGDVITYALSITAPDSGLTETATGEAIILSVNGAGEVEGRTDTSDLLAFVISVDGAGVVTLDQKLALVHPDDTNPDETVQMLADDLVKLTATITDGDGDQDDATIDIGANMIFHDDGPTAPTVTVTSSVIEDESAGINDTPDPNDADDTNNAAAVALFAAVPGTNIDVAKSAAPLVTLVGGSFGADGAAASDSVSYDLSVVDATAAGVSTTLGTQIFLYNGTGSLAGLILGRVGTEGGVNPDTANAAGAIAFAIAVDDSGFGYIAHKAGIAIANPTAGSTAAAFDDVIALTGNAVKIAVTYTDKDGDQATTAPANVGAAFTFQDSGPSITVAVDYPGTDTNLHVGNQIGGGGSATGAFGYDLGTDDHGAAFYAAGGSDFVDSGAAAGVQISLTGTVDNAQNPGITSAVANLFSESASSAVFNFSFNYDKDPITAGVQSASAGGTLTFDKVADTFTIAINDVVDGFEFNVLHTNELLAKAPIGNNGHPNIVVEQLQADDPNVAGNDGFYVQFTADNSPFGFSANGQGGNTADHTFTQGAHDMIGGTPTWVSATQSTNGVAGDTIQSGENLTLRFFNENILADVAGNVEKTVPTDHVAGIALKFDGIGANEDLVMILDLIDPVTHATITRSVTIENGDIYKNSTPGGVPFPYSTEFSLDNNDGLVIIEANDYNLAGEHYEIQGVQIMQSANGQTGSGINLQKAIGAAGGSVTNAASISAQAWNFAGSHTTDVLKITDIGFVEQASGTIDADLHFQFALADADGDTTVPQTIDAHISNLFNV